MLDIEIRIERHKAITLPKRLRSIRVLKKYYPGRPSRYALKFGRPAVYTFAGVTIDHLRGLRENGIFSTIGDLCERMERLGDIAFCLDHRDGVAILNLLSERDLPSKKIMGGATHIFLLGTRTMSKKYGTELAPYLTCDEGNKCYMKSMAMSSLWEEGYAVAFFSETYSSYTSSGKRPSIIDD